MILDEEIGMMLAETGSETNDDKDYYYYYYGKPKKIALKSKYGKYMSARDGNHNWSMT